MTIAEELLAITQRVLRDECTQLQQDLYRAAHGIQPDGTHTRPMGSAELATRFGSGSGNIVRHLAVVEARVYKACCQHLLERVVQLEQGDEATLVEAVGTVTWDQRDARVGYVYARHDHTEHRIHLGPGSAAAVNADKHRRPGAYEQVHQRYADGGRHA